MVAALVALGVGELVSSFAGSDQSLIGSVGSSFINRFAGSLKELAISLFGTNDKAALIVGIVVVSALIGAALGVAARERPHVATIGFAAFGLVGLVAGWVDPQTNKVVVTLAAVAATAAGIGTLRVLLRVAATGSALRTTRTVTTVPDPDASRRAFFGWAGGAALVAVGLGAATKALSGRSKAEVARDAVRLPAVARPGATAAPGTLAPAEAPLGIEGLTPYYMSNAAFYRIDTALVVPQVDPADWTLKVTGMVDKPFELTFAELLALPQIEEAVTLSCVSNEVGGDLVGNARWQGVPLQSLLDRAGVQPGATQLVGRSVDGFTAGFPTELAGDGRVAMIAVGMNGEPLPIPHGFPARLVVAGLYGYVSATKWLSEIHLTTWEDFDGYWVPRGWSKRGPVKTESRIDVPRNGSSIAAGPQKIAGVAWAPNTGIARVEVQVDEGPWREARLTDVVSKNTWVQWVLDWPATPGEHRVRVRATDATGATQTETPAPVAPDGATGWHHVDVTVDAA